MKAADPKPKGRIPVTSELLNDYPTYIWDEMWRPQKPKHESPMLNRAQRRALAKKKGAAR